MSAKASDKPKTVMPPADTAQTPPPAAPSKEKLTLAQLQELARKAHENPNVGETFGGSYERLKMEPNTQSPLFSYLKDAKVPVEKEENGVKRTDFLTTQILKNEEDPKAQLVSTPISAIFQKHWNEANIKEGDIFIIKRYPDAEKKRGAGKGNKMEVYGITILQRA